jgi:DNA polymerase (family 10)
MERSAMTDRVLRALENPYMKIWGHPTARLLMKREPAALDLEPAVESAVRHGVALEINCQPDRLDLSDALIRMAAQKGAHFVISTDSHATAAFDNVVLGVGQARRGWLEPRHVLNTQPAEGLLKSLRC